MTKIKHIPQSLKLPRRKNRRKRKHEQWIGDWHTLERQGYTMPDFRNPYAYIRER
jgi:hypothetical protein